MKLAVTGTSMNAAKESPLVFRGSYPEIIKQAGKIGYDAMELHIHDSSLVDKKLLKNAFHENGMTLSSIGTGSAYATEKLSLSSPDKKNREVAIDRMIGHMQVAQEYDAVVIIGLIKGLVKECSSRSEYLSNLKESLAILIAMAEKLRVVMVLEILNRYESDFLNTINEGLEFIDDFDSEYLQLHIDTYHMNIEERNIGDAIRRAAGKVGHCHIADNDRWYAGHAHFDFGETISALKDIGYSRFLSVESFQYPDSRTSAEQSFRTLKKFI